MKVNLGDRKHRIERIVEAVQPDRQATVDMVSYLVRARRNRQGSLDIRSESQEAVRLSAGELSPRLDLQDQIRKMGNIDEHTVIVQVRYGESGLETPWPAAEEPRARIEPAPAQVDRKRPGWRARRLIQNGPRR